ncbi:hypothetical protein [Algoriphagus persicinus]|uniref:hypothetical protein n=1 Tax=Algoriphagus persicinus TaxID=3108754 RepID=UPI002B3B2DC1|nr:hypothetical protein [Algoriphagus sp. E1-3-M2]MEB2783449.1 hypothetical protein [Algoriphagus sp. E1-3-M2]
MKNLISFLILVVLALSCDFNDFPGLGKEDQKWVIAGYQQGGVSNPSYVSIRDSAYVYTLSTDGTFRKSIGKQRIGGTYRERFEDGLRKFLFQYEKSDAHLIHSCDEEQEEYFLNSKGQLTGTWDVCNGSKLYFDKQ